MTIITKEILSLLGFTIPDGMELEKALLTNDVPDCANPDDEPGIFLTVHLRVGRESTPRICHTGGDR